MEDTSAPIPVVKVLFALYPSVDALDVLGPFQVLKQAQHNLSDPSTKAFDCVFAAATEQVTASQGCIFKAHISYAEVQKRLAEFDVLIIPGGGVDEVIKSHSQPLQIIKAFSDLQIKDPHKERTLMSISTASLLLGHQGTLSGLSATTHPDFFAKFENICSQAALRDLAERADVLEERYVVNNLRFDLEDPEQGAYIRRKSDGRRPSNARKGSMSWKESNTKRESNARRASLRLGGLRVITTGGTSCAIDAALYLVSIMVSVDSAQEVSKAMQHNWVKGVVVDGIDV